MFGRLIEMIIEWFDEYYSVNLSGEVLRGMKEKALRQGYQLRPCLGYDAAGGGKPYTINESEYAVAERIFREYYNGLDLTGVARKLNALGLRTKTGNRFDRRSPAPMRRARPSRPFSRLYRTGWNPSTAPLAVGRSRPMPTGCPAFCAAAYAAVTWATTAPTIPNGGQISSSAGNTPRASTRSPAPSPPAGPRPR